MNIYTYIILFFIYSFLGWILEVVCKLFTEHKYINRGFLIGPLCPIYGFGVVGMSLVWHNYLDDPKILFVLVLISAAVLEYFTSYLFEKVFKARWWNYAHYKYNINGRICLETMIPFAIIGFIILSFINPIFADLANLLPLSVLKLISVVLLLLFIIDTSITIKILFKIKSLYKNVKTDSTEKINRLIRKEIEKRQKALEKRLLNAFPRLEITYKQIKKHKIK